MIPKLIEQIKVELPEYKLALGGSYIFTKECMFRPNWLSGMHIQEVRIFVHPHTEWMKVEFKLEGEWEKFYEGFCKSIEQFKYIKNECLEIE